MRGGGHSKPKVVKDNAERWLLTYADMITLLMLFFIVLYALSNQDVRKYAVIARALNEAFSVDVRTADLSSVDEPQGAGDDFLEQLKASQGGALEDRQIKNIVDQIAVQSNALDEIEVSSSNEGVTISVLNSLLFRSGKAELRPEARQALGPVAKLISELPNRIRVEGHTDDLQPSGSVYQNNLELSVARGYAVAQFLANAGVPTANLSAAGYGDTKPKRPNRTSEDRMHNRRVDIVILNPQAEHEAIPGRP